VRIEIRKSSGTPKYRPVTTYGTIEGDFSLTYAMTLDTIADTGVQAGAGSYYVTDWLSPTEAESIGSSGSAWTTPGDATGQSDDYGESNVLWTSYSRKLVVSGFSIPEIEDGAVISGIEVEIDRYASDAGIEDRDIILWHGDYIGENSGVAGNWLGTDTDTYVSYGEGTGDNWDATLTPAIVTGGNFGVAIAVDNNHGSLTRTAYVDHVRMKVHYYQ
jgi:hypothetical protein